MNKLMYFPKSSLVLVSVILISLSAVGEGGAGGLVVNDAWARATPPGAPMGAVYLRITNPTGMPIRVTEITTPVAKISEIHESVVKDGMSRMRAVEPFIVEPGATQSLQPGGKHIMLMRLTEPLKQSSKFSLTLSGSNGYKTDVEVVVGGFGQMEMPGR